MSKKVKSSGSKKELVEGVKEKTVEGTITKKPRKQSVMKPPIERAAKLARLLALKAKALLHLVSTWQGELTGEQAPLHVEAKGFLEDLVPGAEQILLDIDTLQQSGFQPTGGRAYSSREPLAAGARVQLKPKRFDTELYGSLNDFDVVVEIQRNVRIREHGNLQGQSFFPIPRAWLVLKDGDSSDTVSDLDSAG
jgi:hypothetical protein